MAEELEPQLEPRREPFKQTSKLAGEPKSDVAIRTESGMALRERVRRRDTPSGVSIVFTYARLLEDGSVEFAGGQPMISDEHEVFISAEDSIRAGPEAVAAGFDDGRQVAVARAVDFFKGMDALPDTLTSLLAERV